MRAVQVTRFGGPEVLDLGELPEPQPSGDNVVLNISSAGVNYADTHQAEDSYLAPQTLPFIPGVEVVGRTAAGTRVVAAVTGGYAERCVAHPAMTFDVPDELGDGQALAIVLQGSTAWHLLRTCAQMRPGQSVVVHAAAGGVGSFAVQLARLWGAGRVIAVASSEEKRALAAELGAHATVDAMSPDLREALLDANEGRSVDVVLEMAGGRTFGASMASLAPFGRLISFGMASREPTPPVDPAELMRTSRGVLGFWLQHCSPRMLREAVGELTTLTVSARLRPIVGGVYPLAEARLAHEDLRSRTTVGKLVLQVSPS